MIGLDRQSFQHLWIHSEMTRRKKSLILITRFLRKYLMKHVGNATKMLKTGYDCRNQDQGLRFWQTKSFAIRSCATTTGACIDRVTGLNGDRVIFERLETPRPAPKVTLKSGKPSSSKNSSRSSPFSTQTLHDSGNRARLGKARQECKTSRSTPQKRTKHLETGCNPLLKWTWIPISVKRKSPQMHFRTAKRIIKLLNES